MTKEIINQAINTRIINDNGTPTSEFFTLIELLTQLEIRNGDNTPEGIVAAKAKTLYWDDINFNLYFKTTNDNLNTGWKLI